MVSKQPVMISFDSSIDGGMDAVLNAAADMYLSKGDNGECGGMLPLEDAVALLSDPSDIIDFVSSPEYSAESVVNHPFPIAAVKQPARMRPNPAATSNQSTMMISLCRAR